MCGSLAVRVQAKQTRSSALICIAKAWRVRAAALIYIYTVDRVNPLVLVWIRRRGSTARAPSSDSWATWQEGFGLNSRVNLHILYIRHPLGRGRWHAPSSRHRWALLSACGRCSFGGLAVRACVPVSGVFSLSVCPVCVWPVDCFTHR